MDDQQQWVYENHDEKWMINSNGFMKTMGETWMINNIFWDGFGRRSRNRHVILIQNRR